MVAAVRGDLAEQAAGAGVRRGGDGDVPDAPGVLGGAAFPVVDVDVAADDRAAGVAGVERVARAERVGGDVREALQRDHRGVDGDLVGGRAGGEVQAGGGDPADPLIASHGGPYAVAIHAPAPAGNPVGDGAIERAWRVAGAGEQHDRGEHDHEPDGREQPDQLGPACGVQTGP